MLRTCTTIFAGQVGAGELEIEVNVLRKGRTATQVSATTCNPGARAGATVVAVFGARREGPSFVDLSAPEVFPPAACPSYRDEVPPDVEIPEPLPFWERLEARRALGHAPWESYEPYNSDVATWLRFVDPPRSSGGVLDPLGVVTLADRMPGCVRERTGWVGRRWFAPSADLTVHLLAPLRTEWVLDHDRAR